MIVALVFSMWVGTAILCLVRMRQLHNQRKGRS